MNRFRKCESTTYRECGSTYGPSRLSLGNRCRGGRVRRAREEPVSGFAWLPAIGQGRNRIVIQSVLPVALHVADTDLGRPTADLAPQAARGDASDPIPESRRSSNNRCPTPLRPPPRVRRPARFPRASSSHARSRHGGRRQPHRLEDGTRSARESVQNRRRQHLGGDRKRHQQHRASRQPHRASADFVQRQCHQRRGRRQQRQDVARQLIDRNRKEHQHGQRPDAEEQPAPVPVEGSPGHETEQGRPRQQAPPPGPGGRTTTGVHASARPK